METNSAYLQVKTAQQIISEMKSAKKDDSNTKIGKIKLLATSVQFMNKLAFLSKK